MTSNMIVQMTLIWYHTVYYTTQFQRRISEHMEGINTIDNVEDRYIKFRNALTESAQQVLPDVGRTAKQKMNQRRLAKGDNDLYNLLHK